MKAIITLEKEIEVELSDNANKLIEHYKADDYSSDECNKLFAEVLTEVEKTVGYPMWEEPCVDKIFITACRRASDSEVVIEA